MTDHKAAKEWADHHVKYGEIYEYVNLSKCYLDLTAQLSAKDAVIGELVSVLEFYADGNNWNESGQYENKRCINSDDLSDGNKKAWRHSGGKRARAALARYRESADKGEIEWININF